jgi:DNA-binding CsgD family transcriptional regulator
MAEQLTMSEKKTVSLTSEGNHTQYKTPTPVCPANAKVSLSEMDKFLEQKFVNEDVTVSSLTPRETQILKLIVAGKTNKEISRILCRTQRTIEYHRNKLMHKLKSRNAVDLVKRAISLGVI